MIRILLSTRLGERRMTQSELARATGIRSQTINELYHDFAERCSGLCRKEGSREKHGGNH